MEEEEEEEDGSLNFGLNIEETAVLADIYLLARPKAYVVCSVMRKCAFFWTFPRESSVGKRSAGRMRNVPIFSIALTSFFIKSLPARGKQTLIHIWTCCLRSWCCAAPRLKPVG